jgi:hypothetical protein
LIDATERVEQEEGRVLVGASRSVDGAGRIAARHLMLVMLAAVLSHAMIRDEEKESPVWIL